jgi:hypothetical protein
MKTGTKYKWLVLGGVVYAALTLSFTYAPAQTDNPKLDPPTITCSDATDKTITIQVCGAATTGAPAGFSLQWVPSGTDFGGDDNPNACSASFSGVPDGSTFDLAPGECVDVVVAKPTGATGETFQCIGDLFCSADYQFRAFAHNVPEGSNRSDFTSILLCSTDSCPEVGQGCTPGFWKNRAVTLDLYDTSRTLGSVFTFGPDFTSFNSKTFLEALKFRGGNTIQKAAEILLRAAVAALLNAENPNVAYPRTATEVIDAVNGVLNTTTPSRDAILALAASLDADNNLGCPLGDEGESSAKKKKAPKAKKAKARR